MHVLAPSPHAAETASLRANPTTDENIRKVRRLLTEVWELGDVGLADYILASDIVNHDTPAGVDQGLDGFKEHVIDLRGASSDLHVEVEYLFGADEWVMARLRWQGVHDGPLFGIPPTGRRIDVPQHSVWRFADGKATDFWYCWDETTFLVQIGVIPAPETHPLLRLVLTNLYAVRMGLFQLRHAIRTRRARGRSQT